jgi:signal transduction histidine kinase
MRRQITLLVAATTSVVLLAFLLPAATLVARVAEAKAVDAAQAQAQSLSATVGLGGRDEVVTALLGARTDLDVAVLWTDGEWLGRHRDGGPSEPPTTPTVLEEDGAKRVLQPVTRLDETGTAVIEVFVPAAQVRAGVPGTWLVLAALGAVLLGLSLFVADRLARSLTRPVTDLARTARRLSAGDLRARTTPAGPAEVRDVGAAVDQLAGRIGELLTAEREAAADLAHRLRTPLTALQLDAEALPDGQRERVLDGVDAVSRAVDEVIRESRRPVREGLAAASDAIAVGRDRAHFWSALAADEGRPLTVELPQSDHPLPVRVPADDLTAAVDALLGNVFAHTPDGTPFTLAVEPRDGGGAVVTVRDQGPGMPTWAVERGASGRGSTGLGLDIARRTAEASGGALRLSSSPAGTTVTLELGPPGAA